MSRWSIQKIIAALLVALLLWGASAAHAEGALRQTNVDQAQHVTNANGVPQLTVDGLGVVDHPAWVALYALAYAGIEDYEPSLGLKADPHRFEASIAWLKANLSQNKRGHWVWTYRFDSTYNDITIKAPWASAFAQATGVQALLAHWKRTQDKSSLALAKKAAESLFIPLDEGGFLFSAEKDIWFEEIPSPTSNPSHILNGHMRALLALGELKDATGEARYQEWFDKGMNTLVRWLPLYDAGYWLRYDLNPRKQELLFRLANPYGFANPELAIDRIVLRDPVSGEESVLDVGGTNDAKGPLRIAGNDWGQIEKFDDRTVRRLRPVDSARDSPGSDGEMASPHAYFYMKLPGRWVNNLRKTPYELIVEYFDEKPGNLEIQMRSISPGKEVFKKLKDGDLLISGKGAWRKWRINVNSSDLGFWVGQSYADKHEKYLRALASSNKRLVPWGKIAKNYMSAINSGDLFKIVTPKPEKLPHQVPTLPVYSLDKQGVLMVHLPSDKSRFDQYGFYDKSSDKGYPVYTPYITAVQLIEGSESSRSSYLEPKGGVIERGPALKWFKNHENQRRIGDAVFYDFNFKNIYNDIETNPPWASAFSQAFVMNALGFSLKNIERTAEVKELLMSSAYAYEVPLEKGGISSFDKSGAIYFEEVPNATHVLNAHLVSITALNEAAQLLDDDRINALSSAGIETLRSKLSQFDTGYWMRYDLNPKKELLFQIDWLSGEGSPLIQNISLDAPQFAKRNLVEVGSEQAFEGASRISGTEWLPAIKIDGISARSFSNGYIKREKSLSGGTRHNAYFLLQLPEKILSDYSEIQSHRLVLRYKDVSAGEFVVKIQSINEGNFLDFSPLKNSVIKTVGDQRWKNAIIEVRPQDMGWYKGSDYQIFELEQLENIAKITGDWFFSQYAERQRYFLNAKINNNPVIIEPFSTGSGMSSIGLSVVRSSPTYSGFGFDNSLDGNPNNNYVAGLENSEEEYVELELAKPINRGVLSLRWESKDNYAGNVKIFAIDDRRNEKLILSAYLGNGEDRKFDLNFFDLFKLIRIEFADLQGQRRVLLRQIDLWGGVLDKNSLH